MDLQASTPIEACQDMDAAHVEPISPELVLVSPAELRDQAIALLPDFAWQAFVAQTRARAVPPSAPGEGVRAPLAVREVRAAAVALLKAVPWLVAWFLLITFLILAMTLIADWTR
jgi:hypothetical protein